jgi:spermidine dehydrogenase
MSNDRDLGMNRKITRRDFIEGASIAVAGSLLPGTGLAAPATKLSTAAGNYPPGRGGLRGSHNGSFEVAHQLAREGRTDWGPAEDPDGIVYDLVVVGAGISGLSAARFYQQQHPDATILILDNHDDFGGHAKRNEFLYGDKKMIGYGGSQSIDGPKKTYSKIAKGLLKDLQLDVDRFETAYDREFTKRWGVGAAIYFDRKTYGADRVVRAELIDWSSWIPMEQAQVSMEDAIPQMPITDEAKRQLLYLYTQSKDQVPDHSIFSEPSYLQSISYRDFLTKHMGVTDPQVLGLFQYALSDMMGADLVPAFWGMMMGLPGMDATSLGMFEGLIKRFAGRSEPYIYHFPDGNASIARLLVRRLISGVAPGETMEDIVGAPFDYSRLDRDDSPVRLRLSSTAVHVGNLGDAKTSKEVEVTYVRSGKTFQVRARNCVLACYNQIIPHLCPELPKEQKDALSQLVKIPLIYTNVLLRNWKPWQKLGIAVANCPGTYHRVVMLDFPVSLGSVEFSKGPDHPIIAHMNRMPASPGLPARDQSRAGRMEILSTSFEDIEREVRTHFAGMLGSEGFDPALDIEAITVNRWPHGYAWFANPITDHYEDDEMPYAVGRKRFGRIAIANSDSGGEPSVQCAIDQAHRAFEDLKS